MLWLRHGGDLPPGPSPSGGAMSVYPLNLIGKRADDMEQLYPSYPGFIDVHQTGSRSCGSITCRKTTNYHIGKRPQGEGKII
jgi:hypothetical protein